MQMLNDWAANWGVMQWVALIAVLVIVVGVIGELYAIFAATEQEKGMQKFVVVVRQAAPGEFGGFVSMQSIRRTDDWRVTYADDAGDAVNQVLCAGEVPIIWMKWESLSRYRRAVLTVSEVWRFVRGV